ncbi:MULTISPECIES: hypothetical protein [Isoptericola]|uniref:Uncharacterized protein n=1 Tax=Isoptericola sediminis TaxID=2733572 RepID=A0A849KBQ2_9MICO|nr:MULTISPECIES: hypothetical protein [Isoptericola]MDO8145091.1 hypothetical protein [Isoptericola sp. 178]MDO8148725.1 hypothetical protein [Isoptericola sp. b515]NNU28677.1 hypothetical protein [Isoptericola sediminis]
MPRDDTPIFDALAREFEAGRPLLHVARALGGDPFGDPLARTRATEVRLVSPDAASRLPRRSRRSRARD